MSSELDLLVNFYSEHYSILASQQSDLETITSKKRLYNQLVDSLNANSGNNRTVDQVKTKWSNETSRIKKFLSEQWKKIQEERKRTGGGEVDINFDEMCDLDRRIGLLIPPSNI